MQGFTHNSHIEWVSGMQGVNILTNAKLSQAKMRHVPTAKTPKYLISAGSQHWVQHWDTRGSDSVQRSRVLFFRYQNDSCPAHEPRENQGLLKHCSVKHISVALEDICKWNYAASFPQATMKKGGDPSLIRIIIISENRKRSKSFHFV